MSTIYATAAFSGTGSFNGTLGATTSELPAWHVSGSSSFSVAIATRGDARRTVVVELDGTQLGELETAQQGAVTWALNEWETASITLGIDDPKGHLILDEKFREVQLWRGEELLVFGPITGTSADMDSLSADVSGPLWHFSRRYVGRAERLNRISNGDFERGLSGGTCSRQRTSSRLRRSGRGGTFT